MTEEVQKLREIRLSLLNEEKFEEACNVFSKTIDECKGLDPLLSLKTGKVKIANFHTNEEKDAQEEEFNALWTELEQDKKKIVPGSKWYIVLASWLHNFNEYISQTSNYSRDTNLLNAHLGMITNVVILDHPYNLQKDPKETSLNYNFKKNLIEELYYFTVNKKIIEFLVSTTEELKYPGLQLRVKKEMKAL